MNPPAGHGFQYGRPRSLEGIIFKTAAVHRSFSVDDRHLISRPVPEHLYAMGALFPVQQD